MASQVVIECRGKAAIYRKGQNPCVEIVVPHGMKFKKGFPQGNYVKKTDTYTIYKITAWRLLDWLYNNKLSTYDSKQLVKQTKYFESFENKIDKMFDII